VRATLTTEQAAKRLGVERQTVRRWYFAGRLDGFQLTAPRGPIKVYEDSVEAVLAAAKQKESTPS
jgi:excisionase family DNA binding protein